MMMNSATTFTVFLLVAVVGFTSGQLPPQTYDYTALRCFVCTGPQAPLCDGDDKQQYGVRDVKCSDDLADSGRISDHDDEFGNAEIVRFDSNRKPYPYIQPAVETRKVLLWQGYPDDVALVQDGAQRFDKSILYNHSGEYILAKVQRCWIMKVEYTAHGKIEVYKGCHKNMGDEFSRIWLKEIPSRSIFGGYCETFTSQALVGEDDGKRFYYSHVTVCFCNSHNCNEKTLPHFEKNDTMVGLEDVEQRRWMKKRKAKKKKNSSQTLHKKTQEVMVALFSIFAIILAVYLIRN